jgi:peptide-methionine (S)-S-oxide reductase
LVCTGTTGHCEAVEVEYDPAKVSYEQLLTVFWDEHSPTYDCSVRGGQYRSAIFFHNAEQEKLATASKAMREKVLGQKLYTQIMPAPKFWRAEDYHQNYYMEKGIGQCSVPK